MRKSMIPMALFSILMFSQNVFAKNMSQEAAVQQYFQDQAIKQIEQIVPKGKYSVQVKAEIDYRKIGIDSETPTMALPMLGTMSLSDGKDDGGPQFTIDQLLKYVKKVEFTIYLAPEVTKQARDIISNSISNMVTFEPKRGDKIKFEELPSSMNQSGNQLENPITFLFGGIILVMLFATFMMFFGMSKIANRFSGEFQHFSANLREIFEGGSGFGGATTAGVQPFTQSISQNNADNVDGFSGKQEFWDKIDSNSIAAFLYDCWSNEKFKGVPYTLLNGLYNKELAEELEKMVHPSMIKKPDPTNVMSFGEIHQLYQKHHGEYRKSSRSRLSKSLLNVEISQLIELQSKMNSNEMVILANALTPIKREEYIAILDTDAKIALAKNSKTVLSGSEFHRYESSIIEKASMFAESFKSDEEYDFSSISDLVFKPKSFSEDEALFARSENLPEFFSPLHCLNHFRIEDWEEFSPQESAMVFWGYADEYKKQLIDKYPGKKNEWLKNFMGKFEQSKPEFNSASVEAVREKFKAKYQATKHPGESSEHQKAS